MKEILIQVIPHKQQRYDTAGDWYWEGQRLIVRVSKVGDWQKEFSVAIHEAVEALLCKKAKVPEKAVTAFDIKYEEDRAKGLHAENAEPGMDPSSPYILQHMSATIVERMVVATFGLTWEEYEKALMAL